MFIKDSLKTEQGWKYNYRTLTNGTLNSIEKNDFKFTGRTVQKLKIYINNHHNQPLKIKDIALKGYNHELVARFIEPASYYLTYGNKRVARPNYDIERFVNNIPKKLIGIAFRRRSNDREGRGKRSNTSF